MRVRLPVFLMVTLAIAALAGCAKPQPAECPPCQECPKCPEVARPPENPGVGKPINLINPNYAPIVGSKNTYYKTAQADLDGDGVEETIHVTTGAGWSDQYGFGWDDGHAWHVYVTEPDGTKTYVYSNWVQMGRLDVFATMEPARIVILYVAGAGLIGYEVTYKGPGQHEAIQMMPSYQNRQRTQFVNPAHHD